MTARLPEPAPPSGPAKSHQYLTLDGMRGVAALAIVVRHTPSYFGPLAFPESYLAVDLFFVLSGFVIANAYQRKLVAGTLPLSGFMLLRVVRLYPLYLLGALLGVLGVMATLKAGLDREGWTYGGLALRLPFILLMLPSPRLNAAAHLYPLNPPSWSLGFELFINLVYGLLYRILSVRVLAAIVAVFAPLVIATALINPDSLDVGFTWPAIYGGFVRVGFSFTVGLLLHALLQGRALPLWISPWLILAVEAAVLCASPPAWLRPAYDSLAVLLLFPALVAAGVFWAPTGRGARLFAFFGTVSYAVYILHYSFAHLLKGILLKLFAIDVTPGAPWSGVAMVTFLLLVCWSLDRVYDIPVRRYFSGLVAARNKRMAGS